MPRKIKRHPQRLLEASCGSIDLQVINLHLRAMLPSIPIIQIFFLTRIRARSASKGILDYIYVKVRHRLC